MNYCVLSVILVFLSPPEPPETCTLTADEQQCLSQFRPRDRRPCSIICVAFVLVFVCCLVDEQVLVVLGTSLRYVDDGQILYSSYAYQLVFNSLCVD